MTSCALTRSTGSLTNGRAIAFVWSNWWGARRFSNGGVDARVDDRMPGGSRRGRSLLDRCRRGGRDADDGGDGDDSSDDSSDVDDIALEEDEDVVQRDTGGGGEEKHRAGSNPAANSKRAVVADSMPIQYKFAICVSLGLTQCSALHFFLCTAGAT